VKASKTLSLSWLIPSWTSGGGGGSRVSESQQKIISHFHRSSLKRRLLVIFGDKYKCTL